MLQVIRRVLAMRQRVYRLRVSGPVTASSLSQVACALGKRRWTSPAAVALVVNSEGGSFVQASLVKSAVETYALQQGVPVFTFVEDCALGPGYLVACAGQKMYLREGSVVGGVGAEYVHWNFRKTANVAKIKQHFWVFPKKTPLSDRVNSFKKLSKEYANWLDKLFLLAQSNVLSQISKVRGERIKQWNTLENANWVRGPAAVRVGLADAVKAEQEVLRQELGEVPVLELGQSWLRR